MLSGRLHSGHFQTVSVVFTLSFLVVSVVCFCKIHTIHHGISVPSIRGTSGNTKHHFARVVLLSRRTSNTIQTQAHNPSYLPPITLGTNQIQRTRFRDVLMNPIVVFLTKWNDESHVVKQVSRPASHVVWIGLARLTPRKIADPSFGHSHGIAIQSQLFFGMPSSAVGLLALLRVALSPDGFRSLWFSLHILWRL